MTIRLAEPPETAIHGLGWHPQLPDLRDLAYTPTVDDLAAAQKVLDEHTEIDLRDSGWMPAVYDQGQLGSCTANAAAGNVEFMVAQEGLPSIGTPSRLFIYYNERVAEGTVGQDSGATIRGSIQAVAKCGAPPETDWVYDVSKFTHKPPVKAYKDALADVDVKYSAVQQDAAHIVACFLAKRMVQVGFTVYPSMEQIGSSGVVPMPRAGEQPLGGHANDLCGIVWINGEPYFIDRNSWSSNFGDGGYQYMPLRYLTNRKLASDFWRVDLVGKTS